MNPALIKVPQAIQAERALLGGLLLDSVQIAETAARLNPDDFFSRHNASVFKWLCAEDAKGNKPDSIQLADYIMRSDHAEVFGGVVYATGLPELCPSVANLNYYTDQIKDASTRRRLRELGGRLAEATLGDEPTGDLMTSFEAEVFALSQGHDQRDWKDITALLSDGVERLQDLSDNPGQGGGLMTGFRDLDRLLCGMRGSELIVLAARPGMGKTALALNIAQSIAFRNVGVGVFSLEMGASEMAMRVLSNCAGVHGTKMRSGRLSQQDWPKIEDAHRDLYDAPIYIEDTPGLTIGQIRSKARRLKAKNPNVGLIVVDYIQLMEGSKSARKSGSREQVVSECSRGLKHLAKELEVPVLALAQLNRGVEQRADKRPMLSDLRESGAIEQDADVVMFIYRDDYYKPDASECPGVAEVITAKNRHAGPGKVYMGWSGEYTRFSDMDQGRGGLT